MFGKNWRTSTAGLGMILTAITDIMQGIGSGDWNTINWQIDIASIIGGIGLLFSKDHSTTGGTVMQPSSTEALVMKAEEVRMPVVQAALGGVASAVTTTPIVPLMPPQ